MKEKIELILACIVVACGLTLLYAAFFVPPLGVIDNSVLVAVGEVLTFAGSVLGIDYSYRFKIKQITGGAANENKGSTGV